VGLGTWVVGTCSWWQRREWGVVDDSGAGVGRRDPC